MRKSSIGLAFVVAGMSTTGALAGASYELTPTSGGANSIVLNWGDSFSIDVAVAVTGDTLPAFNSVLFQMRFTEPGLMLMNYAWDAPFGTGDLFDDSTPDAASLPAEINPTTFFDPVLPTATDIEFSNVLIGDSYGAGTIVSMDLVVPQDLEYTGFLFVSLAADTLADGFNELPAQGGQVLQIEIVPVPSTAALLGLAGLAAARPRRD